MPASSQFLLTEPPWPLGQTGLRAVAPRLLHDRQRCDKRQVGQLRRSAPPRRRDLAAPTCAQRDCRLPLLRRRPILALQPYPFRCPAAPALRSAWASLLRPLQAKAAPPGSPRSNCDIRPWSTFVMEVERDYPAYLWVEVKSLGSATKRAE